MTSWKQREAKELKRIAEDLGGIDQKLVRYRFRSGSSNVKLSRY